MALQSCVLVKVIMSLPGSATREERVVRSKALCSKHTTDHQLSPLFFVGMLMFFTVFVKGIPIITLINEKIGGDKFDPSGDAIVVEGTLFVIRSCVKFLVMNVGCALSDHLGRKPITLFFILPNLCMDLMLLFADINRSVIFTIGVLWGFTAITIPTLRAWVSDLCSDDSIEMVNAQGSFRGLTIGPATLLGIPIGTAFALYSNPKYAFLFSLAANLLALVIISRTTLDDTKGIVKRRQRQQQGQGQGQHVVRIQLTKQNSDDQESAADDRSPLHDSASAPPSAAASVTSVSVDSRSPPSLTLRSFPSEGMCQFCLTHAPWSGYEAILELFSADPSAGYLWLIYFLTFCANETYIHTLFNYLMVGGGMSPLQAALAFALAGISYSVSTEHMLRITGSVRGNLIGMIISAAISVLVSFSSFYRPLALIASWIFMALLPFDCSHAGTNGLITRMYPLHKQGEIQGILEQIATLAVLGGYPGSLLFGYFVSSSAPIYWPGVSFTLAALYSSIAALLFYFLIFLQSDGVDRFPISSRTASDSDSSDKDLLSTSKPSHPLARE